LSKRSELKNRIHALGEIKSILGAMKSLSIIEMNKVARYLGAQSELALTIEEALTDFEHFFSAGPDRDTEGGARIFVLIGSERGFCGGFNESVLARLAGLTVGDKGPAQLIVVGRKLASKLDGDPRVIEVLDGPSGAEEIAGTIVGLAQLLGRKAKSG
jgi:F-type H+-transporting ATPase subunit gamma